MPGREAAISDVAGGVPPPPASSPDPGADSARGNKRDAKRQRPRSVSAASRTGERKRFAALREDRGPGRRGEARSDAPPRGAATAIDAAAARPLPPLSAPAARDRPSARPERRRRITSPPLARRNTRPRARASMTPARLAPASPASTSSG